MLESKRPPLLQLKLNRNVSNERSVYALNGVSFVAGDILWQLRRNKSRTVPEWIPGESLEKLDVAERWKFIQVYERLGSDVLSLTYRCPLVCTNLLERVSSRMTVLYFANDISFTLPVN